jgi:hypothetical protein
MLELHFLKEASKKKSIDYLINHIVTFDAGIRTPASIEEVIKEYFQLGKVSAKSRRLLENYYVLLENQLCWGEPHDDDIKEGNTAGVFQTLVQSK